MAIISLTNSSMMIEARIGDVLRFAIVDQGFTGATSTTSYLSLNPDKYQIYNAAGSLISTNDDSTSNGPGPGGERSVNTVSFPGSLFAHISHVTTDAYTVLESEFPVGSIGFVTIYNSSGPANRYVIPFVVTRSLSSTVADSAMSAIQNSALGRLHTCERNQTDLILPRLRRALGLLGEHQKVDGFLYDDDGNITECRIRIFRDNTGANAASLWTDRVNDADPASAIDTGNDELYRYTVTATNLLPRNLRTGYSQVIVDEQADNILGSDGSDTPTNNGSVL